MAVILAQLLKYINHMSNLLEVLLKGDHLGIGFGLGQQCETGQELLLLEIRMGLDQLPLRLVAAIVFLLVHLPCINVSLQFDDGVNGEGLEGLIVELLLFLLDPLNPLVGSLLSRLLLEVLLPPVYFLDLAVQLITLPILVILEDSCNA